MMGICKKCKLSSPFLFEAYPWIHCHHEYEKKEICWCSSNFKQGEIWNGINQKYDKILFCPVCGRELRLNNAL